MTTISISSRRGDFSGALLSPENASSALVLIHDFHGADTATQNAAAKLAAAGHAVLLPDLFAHGSPPADADDAARFDWASTVADTDVVADVCSALDALAQSAPGAKLGVVGWGWGGAFALMAAAQDARVRVACDIGGEISYPVLTAKRPGSPLNFVAGIEGAFFGAFAGADAQLPVAEIERLRARLLEHDKDGEIKIYGEAPPRFWRDEHSPQSVALWRRMEAWLDAKLHDRPLDSPMAQQVKPGEGYPNEASRLHA